MKIAKDAWVQAEEHGSGHGGVEGGCCWHAECSGRISAWLMHAGSFMQRLKEHGIKNAQIQVLHEKWHLPSKKERMILELSFREFVWVREVLISADYKPLLFARTVIPRETISGKERKLQHLKNRSLGSVLFRYPSMKRSEFEVFPLDSDEFLYNDVARYIDIPEKEIWSRYSTFSFNKKRILLTEVFFPAVAEL